MKHTATVASYYQPLFTALAVSALFLVIGILPIKAHADIVSVQTQQVLPPGQNTCQPLTVTAFTPYVYNNNLEAFEFTVSDPSYVALAGSVGNTSVPFNFMTRREDASGNLRIHVDINSTQVNGTLPITITMLSAGVPGGPTCVAVITMNVGSGPVVGQTYPTYPTYPTTPAQTTTPSKPAGSKTSAAPTSTGMTPSTSVATATSAAGMTSPLAGLCSSQASAFRLWLILLVVYALIVGALLWAEFPLSWSWAQTPERIATIILVLLLLLLGFWYFSAACRAALWMPLLAFLIAILGLLAAFWNHPRVTQFLLVEENR